MEIKVLGPGCPKCAKTEQIVREAARLAGVEAEVGKVADFAAIARHGVFSTPAVIVDGQVKCAGRVPSVEEVAAWLS
jgi:small redox-active disulfide protein 2